MSRWLPSSGLCTRSSRRTLPTVLPRRASPAPWSYISPFKVSFPNGPPVHDWRRGGVPDRRPQHLGTPLARLATARRGQPVAGRPDEARDAPVDRGSGHEHLRGRRPAAARDAEDPIGAVRRGRSRGPGGGRGRHAPVLVVDRSGHLARRTVREHRRGTAAARAVAAHLRVARPRRHAGQGGDHRHHERRAVLPAALAGPVDQLAVLDGRATPASSRIARRSSGASRGRACRTTSARGASTRATSTC